MQCVKDTCNRTIASFGSIQILHVIKPLGADGAAKLQIH